MCKIRSNIANSRMVTLMLSDVPQFGQCWMSMSSIGFSNRAPATGLKADFHQRPLVAVMQVLP